MTTTTLPDTTSFDRQKALLLDEIAELNRVLGLTADSDHKVTFGYIGNCDANGARDHRAWTVFLPHPGRVGTSDDSVGSFPTGSLEGIVATRRALKSVTQGVRLAHQA
jgi:hypothetical protein